MTKTSGIGYNFYVGGYDLSGDTASLDTVSKNMSTITVPGLTSEAQERISGKLDAELSWTSYMNPATAHLELRNFPTTDRIVVGMVRATLGYPSAGFTAKQISYDPSRGEDGSITLSVESRGNAHWMDWGKALTAGLRTDTSATNGIGVDFGASYNYGLQAYLQVIAFTGTDVTIGIEESSDDGSSDAYAAVTDGAFTAVTSAPASERIQTGRSQTVEQYLRVVTSGTFSSVTFAVMCAVNRTEYTI